MEHTFDIFELRCMSYNIRCVYMNTQISKFNGMFTIYTQQLKDISHKTNRNVQNEV